MCQSPELELETTVNYHVGAGCWEQNLGPLQVLSFQASSSICKLSSPSHCPCRNSPERAWIYSHSGFGSQEVTHPWDHMKENQAASEHDATLILDSHKGVLRECLATLPEQASLSPSVTLT